LCDPVFRHFSRTPTCGRQTDTDTDGHRAIAYTALALCRALKNLFSGHKQLRIKVKRSTDVAGEYVEK